jgi:hypothetical protein
MPPLVLPFPSWLKSKRSAHGYQVDPSMVGSGVTPSCSVFARTVTRWAASASRLTRVMVPGVPTSWPWKRKRFP